MPETNFFWDPLSDNILQERDETSALTAEYTTEPGLYGYLIGQNLGDMEGQYHFDALGSTLALTDDNQQASDTYAYTAFGETTEHAGSTVNPFQFVGRRGYFRDEQAGNYLVRERQLSPDQMRWLSVDPAGIDKEMNLYRYAWNSPVMLVDSSGQQVEMPAPSPRHPSPVTDITDPAQLDPRIRLDECDRSLEHHSNVTHLSTDRTFTRTREWVEPCTIWARVVGCPEQIPVSGTQQCTETVTFTFFKETTITAHCECGATIYRYRTDQFGRPIRDWLGRLIVDVFRGKCYWWITGFESFGGGKAHVLRKASNRACSQCSARPGGSLGRIA